MNRFLLIVCLAMGFHQVGTSQTIVGTDPENRNALIEEFTGIGCGFCPYGHLEVATFLAANPGDGFSLAIHHGFFAIPDENQPDYRTVAGDGLGAYFSVNAWPNALINRHDHGAGLLYPLNEWQQLASEVISETAYVNIACEASVDVQTRELNVHVEAYYTGDSPEPENFLHVALIQNEVKGPQFSSWFNPDAITPDGAYLHQHMLRDLLTGQWGQTINQTTSGTFIDENFTYTIPETINNVPVRLGDLAIVSFVSETEEEVENVNGAYPELTNFEYALDAGIDELMIPGSSCSFIEGKLIVSNYGSEYIESIEYTIEIEGETPALLEWTEGSIAPFSSVEIQVPAAFFSGMGSLNYTASVVSVNGGVDENTANNSIQESFGTAVEVALPVTLQLTTDNYFGTAWYLYDDQNNVIQQGSGYAYNQTFTIPLTVDAGCYKLEMTDLDGFFFGSYSLKDGNNNTFFSRNGNFGNSEITSFSLPIYAPTAFVDANSTVACIGGTIQFLDASTGGPAEWEWTFEGGNPATSNEKNPQVSYSAAGMYDVSLNVTNALGSDEVFVADFVSVAELSYGNLALDFDGTNDYVEVTNESAFDFTDAMTLEAWIKPDDLSGTQGILSKNFGNNAHPYQIRLTNDEIIFGFFSNTIGWQPIQTSSANLQTGQWTHIACTYDMVQARIYVDGVQKAAVNKNFEIPQNDQPFEIGRTKDVGFEHFNGAIDEVRVWDIALDAGYIAENLCSNYLGSTDPNLVAYFKFNECGGTMLTEKQNGYDGVLIGMNGDEWLESDACPVYNVDFLVVEDPGSVPVDGATINMSGIIRYTDENGLANFTGYESGTYNYTVVKDGYSVADGAFQLLNEDILIEVSLLISSSNNRPHQKIRVYPNPASGSFQVNSPQQGLLEVMDASGRVVMVEELVMGKNILNVRALKPGLYFLRVEAGNEQVMEKIMLR